MKAATVKGHHPTVDTGEGLGSRSDTVANAHYASQTRAQETPTVSMADRV